MMNAVFSSGEAKKRIISRRVAAGQWGEGAVEQLASYIARWGLGILDRLFNKLPLRGKVIFWVLTIVGSVYCIASYGLAEFLLRVIFSP